MIFAQYVAKNFYIIHSLSINLIRVMELSIIAVIHVGGKQEEIMAIKELIIKDIR